MLLVCRIRRVPLYVHWSVPALCIFFIGVEVRQLLFITVALASYLSVVLIHELGHQLAAQRKRYRVMAIEIYPLHGRCRYDGPEVGYDGASIAAAGPVAQLYVAAPFLLYIYTFGYTRLDLINVVLAMFAFFNPAIALFNLLPIPPFDGKRAWSLLPMLVRRRLARPPDESALEAFERARREAIVSSKQ